MLPLVSVVVPNYNHARYLRQRLNSIFNQTYENFEVILLDDCSCDGSQEILKEFKNHPKVTVIHFNKFNSGAVINQWIKGVSYCKGEYVWIAESDDYSDNRFIETVIEPMLNDKSIVLSYSHSNVVDTNNNITHQLNYSHEEFSGEQWEKSFIKNGIDLIKENIVFRNVIPNVSSVLFSKRVLEKNVTNGIGYKKFSDWIVYFYVFLKGKISFNSQPLNFFREHEQTTRVYSKYNAILNAEESVSIRNKIIEKVRLTDNRVDFLNWEVSKQQSPDTDFYNTVFDFINERTILVISPFNNYTKSFLDSISEKKLKSVKEIIDIKAGYSSYNYKNIPVVTIEKSVWLNNCEQVIIFSDNYCDEIRTNIISYLGRHMKIKTVGMFLKELYVREKN